jgi:hypothetical protein
MPRRATPLPPSDTGSRPHRARRRELRTPGRRPLALFNILPFLPLDGGNIVISLVEGLRRRAVPQSLYQPLSSVGIALMLVITFTALSNDLGAVPR